MTIFLAIVSSFCFSKEHHHLRLLKRTLSNDLAEWNPVPSSVTMGVKWLLLLLHCTKYTGY